MEGILTLDESGLEKIIFDQLHMPNIKRLTVGSFGPKLVKALKYLPNITSLRFSNDSRFWSHKGSFGAADSCQHVVEAIRHHDIPLREFIGYVDDCYHMIRLSSLRTIWCSAVNDHQTSLLIVDSLRNYNTQMTNIYVQIDVMTRKEYFDCLKNYPSLVAFDIRPYIADPQIGRIECPYFNEFWSHNTTIRNPGLYNKESSNHPVDTITNGHLSNSIEYKSKLISQHVWQQVSFAFAFSNANKSHPFVATIHQPVLRHQHVAFADAYDQVVALQDSIPIICRKLYPVPERSILPALMSSSDVYRLVKLLS